MEPKLRVCIGQVALSICLGKNLKKKKKTKRVNGIFSVILILMEDW